MSRYIDADVLDRDGWTASRTYPEDNHTMTYEVKKLTDFPAADVRENVKGEWKPFDLTWGRSVYSCSACGNAFEVPTDMGKPMYKFCPYCGAIMEGSANE